VFKGEFQAVGKMNVLGLERDPTAVSGLDHFFGYIYGHEPPGPKGLKKAIIEYEGPTFPVDSQAFFELLADDGLLSTFCKQHPHIQIVVRFRMFFNTRFPGRFLYLANIFSLLFRNKLIYAGLPVLFQSSLNVEVARLTPHAVKIHLPENLRISIMHDSEFSARDLRDPEITKQSWLLGTSSAQINELADVATRVFNEGL
jgi:hypothetical protein